MPDSTQDSEKPDSDPSVEKPLVLAELTEALVDSQLLERYFEDLARCAEIGEILPKLAVRERVVLDHAWTLLEAKAALTAGQVRGIQIRYHYDGAEWWDTLLAQESGVRLVRMRRDPD